MKDLPAILSAHERLRSTGEETLLVTLVRTEGSTYRRPGARMLVLPGCQTLGTISGGCLEPQVAREAWEATRDRRRVVLVVDNSSEEETWGPASGCHGKLMLLAERSGEGGAHGALEMLARVREGDEVDVWPHFFRRGPDGQWEAAELAPGDRAGWGEEIETARENAASRWVERGDAAAFLECMAPPVHLVIVGAGNDAQPVARLAIELGWRVSVIDTRARLATAERFPGVRVCVGGAETLGGLLRKGSVAVLMSHRFMDDAAALGALLPRGLAYIGLLGPRRRTERLLSQVRAAGVDPSAAQLSPVRSPVGLDVGADSPETIALAIVAEIQATLSRRIATPLHQRVGPIAPAASSSSRAP